MIVLVFLIAIALVFPGCQAKFVSVRPPLEEEGEVYAYLQPLPQEAERLAFRLEGISAVRNDGREYPLSLRMTEFDGRDRSRQKLLASGRLPPGTYVGLAFKAKSATLRAEEGEAALLVPEERVRSDSPFPVKRKKAVVLSLSLKYGEAVGSGYRFTPAFAVVVPEKPLQGITGYVTNPGSHNVAVFDKIAGRVTGMIATGRSPCGMALDQGAGRVYVALFEDDAIEVIDVLSGEIFSRIPLKGGDRPREIALTPDGGTLLSANAGSDTVSFVDPGSLLEVGRVSVGKGPNSVSIDRTGRRAFIFNTLSNTISILDIPSRSVLTTISTDPGPQRGQFNRKGDRLYVYYEQSPYITVFDPASLSVTKKVFVGMGVRSIKVDTRTDFLYVSKRGAVTVEVYDPFSFLPADFLRAGGEAGYMTIDGERGNLFLLLSGRKTMTVVSLIGRMPAYEIDTGDTPYWVSMMGER